MYYFLLGVLILDGAILAIVVLLQSGQGGGLASMGGGAGTDNLIGGRQAVTLLTKMSWTCGGLFLGLALVLSVMSSRRDAANPVLKGEFQAAPPAATAPPTGTPAALPGTQQTPAPVGTAPATTPASTPASTTGH